MAVTSATEIMNSALIKLGAERILSANDENNRARLLKEQYPKVRDAHLRAHPWKFAIRRVELGLITPMPTDYWAYSHAFQLPTDCLRVIETDLGDYAEWDVEDRMLLTKGNAVVRIRYIKRVTDVAKFDDNFCEVLAWALAADIAYAVTQSTVQQEKAIREYNSQLQQARSFNAQQGSVKRVMAEEWLDSRFY